MRGCLGDEDRAEAEDGEGAGESEPWNWGLEIITSGGFWHLPGLP